MNIIMVSDAHKMPAPLVYHLGEHTLMITNNYGAPDAFELVAPKVERLLHRITIWTSYSNFLAKKIQRIWIFLQKE